MADDLTNALQQSAHSSTVLQGIMNPAVVNPLAGVGSAISAVSGMQGLAESNAKRAAGQAFLNSIDPATGQPNQSLLLQNLQKDPSTAYAAQSSAASGQALDTSTYNLHTARLGRASDALGSLIGRFPNGIPGDEFHKAIDQEVNTGLITPAEAQQLHSTVGADPKQNSIAATQLYFHNMSNQQQLERMYGTRPQVNAGDVTVFPNVPAPGAGPGPTVVHALPPEVSGQKASWSDARGNPRQGTLGDYLVELGRGNVAGSAYDPSGRQIVLPSSGGGAGAGPTSSTAPPPPPANYTIRSPGAYTGGSGSSSAPPPQAVPGVQYGNPNTPQNVPPPPGGPGGASPTYTGGGIGSVLAPAAPGPRSDVPPPNANVAAILQGMQNARAAPLAGSAMTAGPGAPTAPAVAATPEPGWGSAPGTYGPGPAAPVARPAAVPQPPTQPAAQPGGSGVVIAPSGAHYIPGPSPGTQQEQEASANQYAADRAEAGNFQARIWPMVQARSILQKNPDLTTGIGAQAVNSVKSGLQTLTSIFTPADIQTIGQAKFDELGKYFQQAVNANPFASGSDQRLASAISGSPNTHLSTLANKEIVDAMIGLERMKQAAFTDFQNSGQPGSEWGNFKAKWQTAHDPRAFVADMLDDRHLRDMLTKMSPSELTAYQNTLTLLKANPSILNTAPMPQKQSFLSLPPRPQPNALLAA